MKQQVISCGSHGHLTGILSQPDQPTDTKIAFLTWNTGIGTRVGHFRGHYEMAMVLAEADYSLFRFDLAGRGDSLQRAETVDEQQRNSLDIIDAMDYLQKQHGYDYFVLLGICSGAVDLHHVARIDYRVIGFVMVDTYIHPTRWFKFYYYLQRLTPLRIWRAGRRRLKLWFSTVTAPKDMFFGVYPDRDEIRAAWRDFMKRDLATMVIFTGGFNYLYSYARQFQDMLGDVKLNRRFRFHWLKHSDHIFTLINQRQQFHRLLLDWIQKSLPTINEQATKLAQLTLPKEISRSIQSLTEEKFIVSLVQSKSFRSDELLTILHCYRHALTDEVGAHSAQVSPTFKPRLGRDQWGNPAWFCASPESQGGWQLLLDENNSPTIANYDKEAIQLGRDEHGNPASFVRSKNSNSWYRLPPPEASAFSNISK